MVEQHTLKGAWRITALLFAFMMINFADKVIVGLAGAQIMADMKLTPREFGFVGSSFFFLFSIAAVATGFIVNHVRSKTVLLIMGLVWALVQFPMVGTVGVETLIACRIVLGAGEGPAYPVALHAVYKWFPNEKRAIPGAVVAQGAGVGVILTVPLLNWIITHYNWHYAFGVLGVLGLVWVLLWLVFGEEGPLADELAGQADGAGRVPYSRLLLNSTNLASWCVYFAAYFGLALVLSWFTPYLVTVLAFDQTTAGKLTALVFLVGFFIIILGSWISDRLLKSGWSSRWARGFFAGACVSVGGLALIAVPTVESAGAKIALVILGTMLPSVIYTLGPAMIGEITPSSQRGAMLAIGSAVGTSAGIFAPYFMGNSIQDALSPAAGYHHGFVVCGMLAVAGGAIGMIFFRPAPYAAMHPAPNAAR